MGAQSSVPNREELNNFLAERSNWDEKKWNNKQSTIKIDCRNGS
jgi:hypothetical protein